MNSQAFEFTQTEHAVVWEFSLKNQNDPQMDYMMVPDPQRSLNHLMRDLNYQFQIKMQQDAAQSRPTERALRKLSKKVIKEKEMSLSTFATEIQEDKNLLRAYYHKEDMDTETKQRIDDKCKDWLVPTMNTLPQQSVQHISKSFVTSYFKESGEEQNTDSKYVNDVYLIYMLDGFTPHSREIKTQSKSLVQIDGSIQLNLSVDDRAITDSFLWDSERTYQLDIWMYTKYLVNDLLLQYDITANKQQFETLHEETRVQLRTQLEYKNLLNKHKHLLMNLSTMESTNQVKEYVIPVQIRVIDNQGNLIYSDDLEWDLLNQTNNVQLFCQVLIQDEGIPRQYLSEISDQIRTQIYNQLNWKFTCMSNTFKSLLKERDLPKLKNQANGQIKKNIIYSLDVQLPINPDGYKQEGNVEFHNSEMFSLLSRNIDLLPEEYQKKISFNEIKKQKDVASKITLDKMNAFVNKNGLKIENNPYLPAGLMSHFDSSRIRNIYNTATVKEVQ